MKAVGGRGYGLDLRERIVRAVASGGSVHLVAQQFSVHPTTVQRYLQLNQQGQLGLVRTSPGRPRRVTSAHEAQLLQQLADHADATLTEHARMLEAATGLAVSFKTVDRVFARHGITHKKTVVASERLEEQRTLFLNDLAPHLLTPDCLVFLDESGFHTAMTRGYARAPSHQRAVGVVPRNHGINHTLICTLTLAGPQAPLVLDGAVNGLNFEWYVREMLCPILRPGQVIVLDNLSSHHRASIRTLIEACGCTLLYLPPYSPDFNPIEQMFSKVKALVRRGDCRQVDELLQAVFAALDAVTPSDIHGWFKHVHPSVSL
ncbi:IS630 family transposase [Deinococcus arcticus]|uniref:IS630 family transposase n=1 Tax=Deinococcus arcticus TaxID=2136176 RepID=A0A2T3W325_9DEIO|nr:IS630 family transposase [Deinococcus arcticus]PTA66308.1 IS630 family transposase [Deinococcus arcticus]